MGKEASRGVNNQMKITSLSFEKIQETVNCPWRDCRAVRGNPCVDVVRAVKEVPHKSRFHAAVRILEAASAVSGQLQPSDTRS